MPSTRSTNVDVADAVDCVTRTTAVLLTHVHRCASVFYGGTRLTSVDHARVHLKRVYRVYRTARIRYVCTTSGHVVSGRVTSLELASRHKVPFLFLRLFLFCVSLFLLNTRRPGGIVTLRMHACRVKFG